MKSEKLDISGVYTALVTPFSKDGASVDFKSLGALIDQQLGAGVSGVVACGSTGEAATLSDAEYVEVVRFARERTSGKVPCVAGVSVSATARAVEMARVTAELGCDGILVATPPYNKPSQQGIIAHFRAIKAATMLPLIGYNIPGRSGVAILPSTLGALSRENLIVGIKESSGSVDALADTMTTVRPECQVVSGDDSLALAVLAYGGVGFISASANVMPSEFVTLYQSWQKGDTRQATRTQLEILAKIRALFVESNPVPAKTVLAQRGIIAESTARLPLVPLSAESLEKVRSEFNL
jgi:4-hydroxy-tetrahydrodipicolinate synthase